MIMLGVYIVAFPTQRETVYTKGETSITVPLFGTTCVEKDINKIDVTLLNKYTFTTPNYLHRHVITMCEVK